MISIRKSSPPKSLVEFQKKNPEASFKDLYPNIKSDIQSSLLAEQRHLCAYCESQIQIGTMKIEHWYPQSHDRKEHNQNGSCSSDDLRNKHHSDEKPDFLKENSAIDYTNMLGVYCGGAISSNARGKVLTCDSMKGNRVISLYPPNPSSLQSVSYDLKNGTIFSAIPEIDRELNEILNLNSTYLLQNRMNALMEYKQKWHHHLQKEKNRKRFLEKKDRIRIARSQISKLETMDFPPPYVGFLIFWLQSKVKK